MKRNRTLLRWIGALAVLLGAYPALVLGYTWTCVRRSDFPGGRHGPLDAYRHALASSVVAYTLGGPAVALITDLFEAKGKDSNRMDRHNNRIGATIGARSNSFRELAPAVLHAVQHGAAGSTNTDQITWLPEKKWSQAWMW